MAHQPVSSAELKSLGFEFDKGQNVWALALDDRFREPIYVSNDGNKCLIQHHDVDGWSSGENILSVADLVKYIARRAFVEGRVAQLAKIREVLDPSDIDEDLDE